MPKETYPRIYLYKRIVEAKLFMDRHFLDNVDVNRVANEACLSKFHFLRLFKQTYGITPYQYMTALKIERARELLQDGLTISDTCYSLGFESLSSFNKLFKRHLKVNPSVYSLRVKDRSKCIALAPLQYVPQCYIEYMHWDK
jgi:AraC-like DNA-binding protein